MTMKATTQEGKIEQDPKWFINTLIFMTLLVGKESVCGIEGDDQRQSFDQIMGTLWGSCFFRFTGK